MKKTSEKVLVFNENENQLFELKSIGYFNHKKHIEHSKIRLNIYTSLYFISNGRAKMKMGDKTYNLSKGHLFCVIRAYHKNTPIMMMNHLKSTG